MRDVAVSIGLSLSFLCATGCLGEEDSLPPPTLTSEGTYDLRSEFDLTVDGVLPAPAGTAVDILRGLRDDPSATLFETLDEAGVPLVADLMSALPGAVRDRLGDYIDDYVRDALFDGGPATAAIDEILRRAESVLGSFELGSELIVSGDPDGVVWHTPQWIAFQPTGTDTRLSVAFSGSFWEGPEIIARVRGVSADTDSLSIGDHGFGVDYGILAWSALEQSMVERWGVGPRALLGDAIDCPALAAEVSSHCLLDACVGHQSELRQICEAGLDLIVEELQSRISELRFDALRLAEGNARLVDIAPTDGIADQIADGIWDASIDLGQGPCPMPGSFRGTRE